MEGDLGPVAARLASAGCVAPRAEAAEIVGAAPDAAAVEAWVTRRERGEPLSWITGTALFCGRRVHVTAGVYEPRTQTEELARRAAALLPPGGVAVDLCTGSGAIGAHLRAEVPGAVVVGTDVDVSAATCARRNGVHAVVGDLAGPLRPTRGVDVVTAVAPYVPTDALGLLPTDVLAHEPRRALDGGPDGLSLVTRVVAAAARLLRSGGWLLAEVGGDQADRLAPVLRAGGFGGVSRWYDTEGDLRGIATRSAILPQ